MLDVRAICTLFVEPQHNRRSLFEETSVRPAQFLWGFMTLGGPFFVGPPCDLHTICGAFANMKKFGGLVFGGPPSIPHGIYSNLCDSEVQPTWDFIILNKSRTRPPRHKEANESHARHGAQNFSPISVPSPRSHLCCMSVCLFHVCVFLRVRLFVLCACVLGGKFPTHIGNSWWRTSL